MVGRRAADGPRQHYRCKKRAGVDPGHLREQRDAGELTRQGGRTARGKKVPSVHAARLSVNGTNTLSLGQWEFHQLPFASAASTVAWASARI